MMALVWLSLSIFCLEFNELLEYAYQLIFIAFGKFSAIISSYILSDPFPTLLRLSICVCFFCLTVFHRSLTLLNFFFYHFFFLFLKLSDLNGLSLSLLIHSFTSSNLLLSPLNFFSYFNVCLL